MLEKGVTVSRTGDDLVRYHGKLMIVDREALHVYGFNYTATDVKSRSFRSDAREGGDRQPHRRRPRALPRQADDRGPGGAPRVRLQLHGHRRQEPELQI